jgi:hypothetical protein
MMIKARTLNLLHKARQQPKYLTSTLSFPKYGVHAYNFCLESDILKIDQLYTQKISTFIVLNRHVLHC